MRYILLLREFSS